MPRSGANSYTVDQDVTLDVASVPASTVQVESFTVARLKAGVPLKVSKVTRDTGLYVIEAEASAADTLELTFWNPTGSPINPASQTFHVIQL